MKKTKVKGRRREEIEKTISENFWEVYLKNTSTLSSICRQLAFAEGGICWFFLKFDNNEKITSDIKIILIFIVLFFIFDACQYFTLGMYNKIIALFYEQKLEENIIKNKNQITRPPWINSSGNFCFVAKLFCIGIASFFIIGKFFFKYFLNCL